MFYYFYKITNNINGKYYYGVHLTDDLNDGYMGSGKRLHYAYNKYGKENFTKSILKFFNNKEDMFDYENEVVNEDMIHDSNCYNIALGGRSGFLIAGLTEDEYIEHCKKISKARKGIKMSEVAKLHISIGMKERAKDIEWRRRVSEGTKRGFTEESRRKISLANKGKIVSAETRQKLSVAAKGRIVSPEQRQKISNTLKGTHLPESTKKKLSELTSNTKWLNNGTECKRIKSYDVDKYLLIGYTYGRLKNNKKCNEY